MQEVADCGMFSVLKGPDSLNTTWRLRMYQDAKLLTLRHPGLPLTFRCPAPAETWFPFHLSSQVHLGESTVRLAASYFNPAATKGHSDFCSSMSHYSQTAAR